MAFTGSQRPKSVDVPGTFVSYGGLERKRPHEGALLCMGSVLGIWLRGPEPAETCKFAALIGHQLLSNKSIV